MAREALKRTKGDLMEAAVSHYRCSMALRLPSRPQRC